MPGTITISLAVEVDEETGEITAYNGAAKEDCINPKLAAKRAKTKYLFS